VYIYFCDKRHQQKAEHPFKKNYFGMSRAFVIVMQILENLKDFSPRRIQI
jgi:hypothetical protein